jgi:hypothetical protein
VLVDPARNVCVDNAELVSVVAPVELTDVVEMDVDVAFTVVVNDREVVLVDVVTVVGLVVVVVRLGTSK